VFKLIFHLKCVFSLKIDTNIFIFKTKYFTIFLRKSSCVRVLYFFFGNLTQNVTIIKNGRNKFNLSSLFDINCEKHQSHLSIINHLKYFWHQFAEFYHDFKRNGIIKHLLIEHAVKSKTLNIHKSAMNYVIFVRIF